jgi:hypothetical protein
MVSFGNGWLTFDFITNTPMLGGSFAVPTTCRLVLKGAAGEISGGGSGNGAGPYLRIEGPGWKIHDIFFSWATTDGTYPYIDLASAARGTMFDNVTLNANGFNDDMISIESIETIVKGVLFRSMGAGKTILEVGAADYTLVTGCIRIASGGGFTIPGANSLVGADNIG